MGAVNLLLAFFLIKMMLMSGTRWSDEESAYLQAEGASRTVDEASRASGADSQGCAQPVQDPRHQDRGCPGREGRWMFRSASSLAG